MNFEPSIDHRVALTILTPGKVVSARLSGRMSLIFSSEIIRSLAKRMGKTNTKTFLTKMETGKIAPAYFGGPTRETSLGSCRERSEEKKAKNRNRIKPRKIPAGIILEIILDKSSVSTFLFFLLTFSIVGARKQIESYRI